VELCPKKVIDKLTRPGIILVCLVLENEVCKEGKEESFIQVYERLTTT
jgi:hypothetical protein